MLAAHQHGLALITEKLQNQKLEEPAGGSSGVAPAAGSSTSSSFCGKLPAVSQDTFLISDHPGQSATALSVKGKNVWTLSLEADRTSQHGTHHHHHTEMAIGSPSTLHTSSSPRSIVPSMCRHKKLRHLCQICDTAPGTPSAPPKKKHCRSLSVPPDGPSTPTFFPSGKDSSASPCTRFSIGIGGHGSGHGHGHSSHHHHHHHHQLSSSHHSSNSKIWRPIAVVPLRGSGTAGTNSGNSSGSSKISSSSSSSKTKGGKERINANTGLHHHHHHHHHHHYPPANFSHTISAINDDNNNSSILTSVSGINETNNNNIINVAEDNNIASPSISSRISSCSSSSLLKHKLMPPSSSSSASFDSGHFTTSDLQTPPSSPIPQPRPASAASDASYSSIGWFDFSPMRGRLNILQNRSLSCEDRISACSSCCSSSSPFSCSSSSTSAGTTTSMPSVYNYNSSNKNSTISGDYDNDDASSVNRAGGSSSGRGSAGGCCPHHSGSGGLGEVVPRCHSQPCVLHHRRCGKKRRRDCDRPTLNFNKMTETAYVPPHPHRRSDPWSSPSYDAQMRSWQGHGHHIFNMSMSGQNQQNQFYLNPIASSPSDTSEILMSRNQQQYIAGGRIDHGLERTGKCLDSSLTNNLTPPDVSPNQDEDKDDGNDDEDEEEDEDERNCNCHDNQRESDNMGMFPMGDLEDLDLEQIETH